MAGTTRGAVNALPLAAWFDSDSAGPIKIGDYSGKCSRVSHRYAGEFDNTDYPSCSIRCSFLLSFISRKRYGSVLCLERSGLGSTPSRVTNLATRLTVRPFLLARTSGCDPVDRVRISTSPQFLPF